MTARATDRQSKARISFLRYTNYGNRLLQPGQSSVDHRSTFVEHHHWLDAARLHQLCDLRCAMPPTYFFISAEREIDRALRRESFRQQIFCRLEHAHYRRFIVECPPTPHVS